jgi:hypothetical protein
MLKQLVQFADQALSYVRHGSTLPLQQGRAPGERPGHASEAPEVERCPGLGELRLLVRVPGATRENTLVCWDAPVHALCVRVARDAAGEHDWYAELRLPANIAGEKSRCVLSKEGVLRIRAPEEDTPASTGLVLLATIAPPEPLAACGA